MYLLIATLLIDSGQTKLSNSRFRYQLRKLLLESTVFPGRLPKIANTKYGQTSKTDCDSASVSCGWSFMSISSKSTF